MFHKHSITAAKEKLVLEHQGSRAQLKQTLISIMVTLNLVFLVSLFLSVILVVHH